MCLCLPRDFISSNFIFFPERKYHTTETREHSCWPSTVYTTQSQAPSSLFTTNTSQQFCKPPSLSNPTHNWEGRKAISKALHTVNNAWKMLQNGQANTARGSGKHLVERHFAANTDSPRLGYWIRTTPASPGDTPALLSVREAAQTCLLAISCLPPRLWLAGWSSNPWASPAVLLYHFVGVCTEVESPLTITQDWWAHEDTPCEWLGVLDAFLVWTRGWKA